ncbi:hypothetical protein [Pseudoalteromonas sp. SG44-17]|uniref:hypothetical protein n=1 Tax=Pseudoalteromonas sp. SG44-17 TaxID=2760963 RepID=UPI00160420DF|nr:hypothetical protein [Pseudoalteromonas sp. SG44-17]MBB1410566.1 hypothetical protein [Pseudoalteromonas sp. SG44-17]
MSKSFGIDSFSCKKALERINQKSLLSINVIYTQSRGGETREFKKNDFASELFLKGYLPDCYKEFIEDIAYARRYSKPWTNIERAVLLLFRFFEYENSHSKFLETKVISQTLKISEARVHSTIKKLKSKKKDVIVGRVHYTKKRKGYFFSSLIRLEFEHKNKLRDCALRSIFVKDYFYRGNSFEVEFLKKLHQKMKSFSRTIAKSYDGINRGKGTDPEWVHYIFNRNLARVVFIDKCFKGFKTEQIENFYTFDNLIKTYQILNKLNLAELSLLAKNIISRFICDSISKKAEFPYINSLAQEVLKTSSKSFNDEEIDILEFLIRSWFKMTLSRIETNLVDIAKTLPEGELFIEPSHPLKRVDCNLIFLGYGIVSCNMLEYKGTPLSTMNLVGFNVYDVQKNKKLVSKLLIKIHFFDLTPE